MVAILDMVQKGETSKQQAASELDTSCPTIDRTLDCINLYGPPTVDHNVLVLTLIAGTIPVNLRDSASLYRTLDNLSGAIQI